MISKCNERATSNKLLHNIFPDLELAIVNSDRDIRSATVLKRTLDVKGWLKSHIDTPTNHTNPHNFLFRLDEQQQCVMQYRNWSSDAWMAGVKLLGLVLNDTG